MSKIENEIEFLFIDMEWNQRAGTKDLEGREPIQIGLLGTDGRFKNTKLFEKSVMEYTDEVAKIHEELHKKSRIKKFFFQATTSRPCNFQIYILK